MTERLVVDVIGVPIDSITWDGAVDKIADWGRNRESRVVCICNSHSLVTARGDSAFMSVVRDADMATPDGAPVAFMIGRLLSSKQDRINGPDLMLRVCARFQDIGLKIFLYGGSEAALKLLVDRVARDFPRLQVVGAYSPPFRPLTDEEDNAVVNSINKSGASVVWVGLGCPKQELWMHEHRGRINAVMVGVGAAFDYHSGLIKRAPLWMRNCGFEWFHRLMSEPRRLWRRYLVTNSKFIFYAMVQFLSRFRTNSD